MNVYPMNQEVVLSHLTAEQRHLHQRLQKIQKLLNVEPQEVPRLEKMTELQQELTILRGELGELYRREEEGGLLEDAVAQRPVIGPHVMALNHEHPALLAELDRLLVFCQGVPVTRELWQMLGEQYRELKRKLCEHELQSNRLVQQGFNFDCQDLLD